MSKEPETQPASEKSLWETIKGSFKQVQNSYRSLDIKGTIEQCRENINHDIFENPTLKQLQHLPNKPNEIAAEIDQELRAVSIKFNESYPYAASMCRSHPALVLGTFLAVSIFPLWRRASMFKTVAKSTVALTLLGQGTLEVVNYQWNHKLTKSEYTDKK